MNAMRGKPEGAPIEFCGRDRYHARTYVLDHMADLAPGVRARLGAALTALDWAGPVRVQIAEDGTFSVWPFEFVQV
jgi:hypothetical protein